MRQHHQELSILLAQQYHKGRIMQYEFLVKHLKEDDRGYASSLYLEMQGTNDSGKKAFSSVSVSFGGDDYKPKLSWTQEQTDQLSETMRSQLQQNIDVQLEEKVTVSEDK